MIRRPPRSTLSLHDALPISGPPTGQGRARRSPRRTRARESPPLSLESPEQLLVAGLRSEEHTSELQSQSNLVCRLLLEKKTYANVITQAAEGCMARARTTQS